MEFGCGFQLCMSHLMIGLLICLGSINQELDRQCHKGMGCLGWHPMGQCFWSINCVIVWLCFMILSTMDRWFDKTRTPWLQILIRILDILPVWLQCTRLMLDDVVTTLHDFPDFKRLAHRHIFVIWVSCNTHWPIQPSTLPWCIYIALPWRLPSSYELASWCSPNCNQRKISPKKSARSIYPHLSHGGSGLCRQHMTT